MARRDIIVCGSTCSAITKQVLVDRAPTTRSQKINSIMSWVVSLGCSKSRETTQAFIQSSSHGTWGATTTRQPGTTLPEPKNPVVAGVNETPNVPADGSGGRGGHAAGDKENSEIRQPGNLLTVTRSVHCYSPAVHGSG